MNACPRTACPRWIGTTCQCADALLTSGPPPNPEPVKTWAEVDMRSKEHRDDPQRLDTFGVLDDEGVQP